VLVAAGGATAQTAHGHGSPTDSAAMQKMIDDMIPKASDPPAVKAYKETHMAMMKSMHIALSGDADVEFVRGMIPHHQGAIDMAKVELQYGKDSALKSMAEKIIADQEKEIAEMKAWLAKSGK
jgi:uncharacterized protein (DUF305 family)